MSIPMPLRCSHRQRHLPRRDGVGGVGAEGRPLAEVTEPPRDGVPSRSAGATTRQFAVLWRARHSGQKALAKTNLSRNRMS